MTSEPPPGGYGTISRTGRDGYDCGMTAVAVNAIVIAAACDALRIIRDVL